MSPFLTLKLTTPALIFWRSVNGYISIEQRVGLRPYEALPWPKVSRSRRSNCAYSIFSQGLFILAVLLAFSLRFNHLFSLVQKILNRAQERTSTYYYTLERTKLLSTRGNLFQMSITVEHSGWPNADGRGGKKNTRGKLQLSLQFLQRDQGCHPCIVRQFSSQFYQWVSRKLTVFRTATLYFHKAGMKIPSISPVI